MLDWDELVMSIGGFMAAILTGASVYHYLGLIGK